ncbi:MAG: hypothetical protein F6K63_29370 [Moorea sp. SIO1G6]|nr:hypothetical protein [Moorena sp. SIO3B2]NEQ07761.1 hypothetical protein [Moorena sp. SIO4E2]NEQ14482.1 hypothetical protein [Moorena sp. SIO3E2]NES84587.1 hypothetical protein [Moorena sp. SIO2B7]NET68284.1 hypothetical protein [Moorena sp. SIO1G6]
MVVPTLVNPIDRRGHHLEYLGSFQNPLDNTTRCYANSALVDVLFADLA